jgi:hypothetical protein
MNGLLHLGHAFSLSKVIECIPSSFLCSLVTAQHVMRHSWNELCTLYYKLHLVGHDCPSKTGHCFAEMPATPAYICTRHCYPSHWRVSLQCPAVPYCAASVRQRFLEAGWEARVVRPGFPLHRYAYKGANSTIFPFDAHMLFKARLVQSSRFMREYEACMILKYCIPCSTLYGDSEHRVLTRRPVQTNWIKKSQNSVSLLCFPQIPSLHQRLSR